MAAKYVVDMTKGNITRHLVSFTMPLLAGNLFQQLYNFVDSAIVGRAVGRDALGAVGSVGSLNFLFFSLCLGLSSGIGILVSQFFGAKKEKEVKTSIAQALYVTLAAGFLMSILGVILSRPILLYLMKTPPANFEYALTYMRILTGFTFVVALYNSISAILRSLGDSKTPLIFLVVASVINIGLDLLFVVKYNYGVAGAAYATVISQGVSAIGSVVYGVHVNPYLKLTKEDFKVNASIIKREIAMGLPLAAQSSTIAISCVVLQGVVNRFGSVAMAAYTVSNRVEQLVQQPFNSLGLAMSTFAGQNYGAGKKDRIFKAAKNGTVMIAIFSAIMVLVMSTLGYQIVGIFITDPEVQNIGAAGMKFTSLMYIFLGFIYVMRGLLNGVGDVNFSMINGFMEVAGRIGFAFVLIFLFNMNYMAAWYTNGLTWTLVGIISIIRFYCGNWKNKISVNIAKDPIAKYDSDCD